MKTIILFAGLLSAVVYAANKCADMTADPAKYGLKAGTTWHGSDAGSENDENCIYVDENLVTVTKAEQTCKEQLVSAAAKDKYIVRLAWIETPEKAKLVQDNMHGDKKGAFANLYFIGLKSTKDEIDTYNWYSLNDNEEKGYNFGTYPPDVKNAQQFGEGNKDKQYIVVSMKDIKKWTRAYGNLVHPFVCEIIPKNNCDKPIDCESLVQDKILKENAAVYVGDASNGGTCISVFGDKLTVERAQASCENDLTDSAKAEYGARLVWIRSQAMQDLIMDNRLGLPYYFIGLRSLKEKQTKDNYYWFDSIDPNDEYSGRKLKFNFALDFDTKYDSPEKFGHGKQNKPFMVITNDGLWNKAFGYMTHGYICEIYRKGCELPEANIVTEPWPATNFPSHVTKLNECDCYFPNCYLKPATPGAPAPAPCATYETLLGATAEYIKEKTGITGSAPDGAAGIINYFQLNCPIRMHGPKIYAALKDLTVSMKIWDFNSASHPNEPRICAYFTDASPKICKTPSPSTRPGPLKVSFSKEELQCKEFQVVFEYTTKEAMGSIIFDDFHVEPSAVFAQNEQDVNNCKGL